MSAERWTLVRALVEETLTLPREAQDAFLDRSCGDDTALREQVGRLAAAYERADENWGFLAQPAGELVAPLISADEAAQVDPASRLQGPSAAFCRALGDRYAVGAELGRGGMATVYVADDLRNQRRVAIKVLHSDLGVMLGAQRFLTEIRVTANLQHPNLLPLFDSGEAAGLLYYVMPLIESATLRARLDREQQLPVDEALRIVRAIAGALDYAHRQGVVHRDLKPENILLQDGEPLVADFGIALAITKAADTPLTGTGISLGTPRYMSPEQAAGSTTLDGRSDIFSLGCVLYELLTGDPPFTGSTAQAVIASVISDVPVSVRTVRPTVPIQVEATLARALSKLAADRHATAREFGDALIQAPVTGPIGAQAPPSRWRNPTRLLLRGAAAAVVLAGAIVMAFPKPEPSSSFVHSDLIDQTYRSAVTITPDGGTLVYTGSVDAGRPIMLRPVGQLAARAVAGTQGGYLPFVSPDGQRLAFWSSDEKIKTVSIGGVAATDGKKAWRYGNGAWVDDSVVVSEVGARGLLKSVPGGIPIVLTLPDSAHGDRQHRAPLLLPGTRAMVFTSNSRGGPFLVSGQLAMASIDPGAESLSPHVLLGVSARRAFAFVREWLLYISADGKAIMAVRLDVEGRRIIGTPVSVLDDEAGNLETASLADNGTLLYVRRPRTNSLVLVDSSGAVRPDFASAEGSFMYPRFSPDGKRFAVTVSTVSGSDVWLYDIASKTPSRLTTTGSALLPTWTPDARRIVFMTGLGAGPRQLKSQPVDGGEAAETVPGTERGFAATVLRDSRTVVFQRGSNSDSGWRIWSAPLSGEGAARQVMDDPFDNYMPAVSPDGHWLAYVSKKATGNEEVYVRTFPGPGRPVQVSDSGGIEPAWSTDGTRIYYQNKSAFMAAVVTTPALAITSRKQLFSRGAFDDHLMPHRNYDVMPDGTGFLTIAPPRNPEAVVVINWLTDLRAQLKRAN